MFASGSWARAFINLLEESGADIANGLAALEALSSWAGSLDGAVFGSTAAEKLEVLIREGMKAASPDAGLESAALNTAVSFFLFTVKKNNFRHIDLIMEEIKKLLDEKQGLVTASLEYALPMEKDLVSKIQQVVKERSGATSAVLTEQHRPELIGGYRLRIGYEIIDASIRSQLFKLEESLAGDGGY